jgi:YD repeat-containing protein
LCSKGCYKLKLGRKVRPQKQVPHPMNIPRNKYLLIISFCAALTVAHAQDKTGTLQAPPSKIAVDGDSKDWGDSLRYYDAEKHLNYSIANSKDTLYMAIRFNDKVDQMRVLRAGLTFSMDPKGRKKETFSITFPLNTQTNASMKSRPDTGLAPSTKQEREELMRERLTTLRGIKVDGFKDIEDEMITTSNTYGIQTAVNYDDNGYLVCEAAIPMQYFHVDASAANVWAFNFKINAVERKLKADSDDQNPDSGGGRHGGGMGGGGMGGGGGRHGGRGGSGQSQSPGSSESSELSKSTDFWTKFYLAK